MNSRLIVVIGCYVIGLFVVITTKAGLLLISNDAGAIVSTIIISTGLLFSAITQPKEDNEGTR